MFFNRYKKEEKLVYFVMCNNCIIHEFGRQININDILNDTNASINFMNKTLNFRNLCGETVLQLDLKEISKMVKNHTFYNIEYILVEYILHKLSPKYYDETIIKRMQHINSMRTIEHMFNYYKYGAFKYIFNKNKNKYKMIDELKILDIETSQISNDIKNSNNNYINNGLNFSPM